MSKGKTNERKVERNLVQVQAKANSPQEKPLRPKFCIGTCAICPYCR